MPWSLKEEKWVRSGCSVCNDTGWVSISFFGKRAAVCTCGAGPCDELTLHAPECDSVRCPFDQLMSEAA